MAGLLAAIAIALASCGGDTGGSPSVGVSVTSGPSPSGTADPSPSAAAVVHPRIRIPPVQGPFDWKVRPRNFVEGVDNPYFPLVPGRTLIYEGTSAGRQEIVRVEVLRKTKTIMGVTCVVVKDTVSLNGQLAEFTLDWYAEDVAGNVWYFGEDTAEYSSGQVTTRAGSWEAGVDGALPGVIMPGTPKVGLAYTQEHYAGQAEDKGRIVALRRRVTVPYGSFDRLVVTEDWTPLEPEILERKSYAPGIGVVFEQLIQGGDEQLELVRVRERSD